MLSPNLATIAHILQAHADHQLIAGLYQPPGEDGSYAHVAAYFLRVAGLPFVSKNCVTRRHGKIGQLREAVDQALRNPVAEILGLRVVAYIRKG